MGEGDYRPGEDDIPKPPEGVRPIIIIIWCKQFAYVERFIILWRSDAKKYLH